jgi:hypothetical protein
MSTPHTQDANVAAVLATLQNLSTEEAVEIFALYLAKVKEQGAKLEEQDNKLAYAAAILSEQEEKLAHQATVIAEQKNKLGWQTDNLQQQAYTIEQLNTWLTQLVKQDAMAALRAVSVPPADKQSPTVPHIIDITDFDLPKLKMFHQILKIEPNYAIAGKSVSETIKIVQEKLYEGNGGTDEDWWEDPLPHLIDIADVKLKTLRKSLQLEPGRIVFAGKSVEETVEIVERKWREEGVE